MEQQEMIPGTEHLFQSDAIQIIDASLRSILVESLELNKNDIYES